MIVSQTLVPEVNEYVTKHLVNARIQMLLSIRKINTRDEQLNPLSRNFDRTAAISDFYRIPERFFYHGNQMTKLLQASAQ